MSNLTDALFANNDRIIYGKQYLRSVSGEPVVISKSIRYTIRTGDSVVHMDTREDVADYCHRMQYQKTNNRFSGGKNNG